MRNDSGRSHKHLAAMLLYAVLWGWLGTGCNNSMLPTSIGQPYEVLVAAADSMTADIAIETLTTPMPGLPQEEPAFDATYCENDKLGPAQRLMRNIVIIDIDSCRHSKVEIRFERNKHAAPQMIIYMNAPSQEALRSAIRQGAGKTKLVPLLLKHEEDIQITLIDKHRNTKMEQTARRMFDIDIHLPANMQSCKTEQGFLWCADNGGSGMQGLCILDGTQADSVLQRHVKGEKDEMYMVLKHEAKKTKNRVERGLWEMKGDAMGGPYIMRTINTRRQAPITLLGFVYAPGHDKRLMVRRLEAIINSATMTEQK